MGLWTELSTNKRIYLHPGSTLEYLEEIPKEYTLFLLIKLPSNFTGIILKIGDDFQLGYNGEKFYVVNQYRLTAGQIRNLPIEEFEIRIISNQVIIKSVNYTEFLF